MIAIYKDGNLWNSYLDSIDIKQVLIDSDNEADFANFTGLNYNINKGLRFGFYKNIEMNGILTYSSEVNIIDIQSLNDFTYVNEIDG